MSRISAIYSLLSADANISGIVSDRIYPVFPPQGSQFPLIVFAFSGNDPTNMKDGAATLDLDGLQVDVYTRTALEGETLDGHIRTALDAYTGTVLGVVIREIYYVSSATPEYDKDINVHWKSSDYRIKVER